VKTVYWLLLLMSYSFSTTNLELLSYLGNGGLGGTDGLNGAISTAASPDGKNVYMVGTLDSAIVILNRDTVSGALTYSRCIKNGQIGTDGLQGGISVTVSPDNRNVYVAGAKDSALVIFKRNPSGQLAYYTHLTNDKIGVKALSRIRSVVVSPDNKNVYTIGVDSILVAFNRDMSSGALSFSTLFKNRQGGVDGLATPMSLVISPDNKNVYVACLEGATVVVFNREISTGALTYSTCLKNGEGGVHGLSTVLSLAISPDTKNLYTVNLWNDTLSVFNRDEVSGALAYSINLCTAFRGYAVAVSPDNKNVFVTNNSSDSLTVFNRDLTSGALNETGKKIFHGLNGASSLTFTPDCKNVYLTSANNGASPVSILNRDMVTGAFSCIGLGHGGVLGLNYTMSVVVSPDNKNVYVAGASDSAIAMFNRNTENGLLTFNTYLKDGRDGVDGLSNMTAITINQDGKNVYAVSVGDSSLAVFNRNQTTGVLTYSMCFRHGRDGIQGPVSPRDVAVSSDNRYVYVASFGDHALMVFNRDSSTGNVTYKTTIKDGVDGVDGLEDICGVATSKDNENVYVIADHSIVVFKRHDDGSLVYDTCYTKWEANNDRFVYPTCVVVSPDDKIVCMTGADAFSVFNRDAITGRLSPNARFKNDLNGESMLKNPEWVTISKDNKTICVTGFGSFNGVSGIEVFSRDLSTGTVSFDKYVKGGQDGLEQFKSGYSVALSPDNKNLYVATGTGYVTAPQLAVFSIQPDWVTSNKNWKIDPPKRYDSDLDIFSSCSFYEMSFDLKTQGNVNLSLHDAQGRLVQQIHKGYLNAGMHHIHSDFKGIPKGLYLLRFSSNSFTLARKVIIN
jgi:DNA-binding beta-propeller fold protein YncE